MSIGADASTSTIGWVEESAWGETPATPEFQNMRQTGNGLSATLNKAVSDEITQNSAVTDVIPTQGGSEGDVNFEPSYGASMDMMFEQTLRNVFDEYGVLKGDNEYKSITLERIMNVGGTPFYFRYSGARSNSLALTFDATATSPITGTFNVMAKEEATDTAIVSGATYVAANSNPVMSMPELRAVYVEIEGVSKVACFTTLSPTINNNLRSQQGKCTNTTSFPDLTAKGEGYGRREVTLDIGYYFNDLDFVQMFQENTEGKMSYILSDGAHGYKITYPRFKIMESSIPIEGNDSDVIQTMSIQALYDSTEGTDIIIEKIPNLATGAAIQFTGAPVPAGLLANFYKDGTQQNGQDVYVSVNGSYGLWYDGVNYSVTDASDVGTGTVEYFFIAGTNPVGSYTVGADGSGTLDGAAYDPAS